MPEKVLYNILLIFSLIEMYNFFNYAQIFIGMKSLVMLDCLIKIIQIEILS